MSRKDPYYVLGMDPGIASCGFALLDLANEEILELGAHLFDAPQNPKDKVSNAVARRNARSARRNISRTKDRQNHCLKLLKKYGLAPDTADKGWLQSAKGDRPILQLRAEGLDRLLSNREFSQVLYSLSGRRGYIPHGEGHGETADKDAEGKKVLNAILANQQAMESGLYRTVGEMLYTQGSSRNKQGNYEKCVYNSQIVDEARALFTSQRNLGSSSACSDFEEAYINCLTWEKKTLDHDERVYALVGNCVYFPEEKRAAQATLSSELCRAYERFGHLVIVGPDGSETSLTHGQRSRFLSVLFSPCPIAKNQECKVTYSYIRKALDLGSLYSFKNVDSDDEKSKEVFAPRAWRALRKNVSEELMRRMANDRNLADAIAEALTFASTEDSLLSRLEKLDLAPHEIDEVKGVPFAGKIFKGYGNRSLRALGMLISMFEEPEIQTLSDAERAAGLDRARLQDKISRTSLLPPYDSYDPTCNNPVVLRALSRMRKIVNAIIRIYGVPHEIHIELGRELKHSLKEKKLIAKANRANAANNKRLAEMAAEVLGITPEEVGGKVLRKLSLWEEQDGKDIYTAAKIEFERLVTDDRYAEIDHVLPYSRTCDDSKYNKVLVLAKSNQDKREQTPFEWMTRDKDAPQWDEFKARILNTDLSYRKRSYLLNTNLDEAAEAQFISRNLNDTRYMSRAVKDFLENTLNFPDIAGRKKHVIAVSGGATATLRWVWGLNYGADNMKDREDPRHHAIDAAIIAACSESSIKRIADARSRGHESFKRNRESRLANTQPWPTFAQDIDARRDSIIPTRMANHGVTGRAFQDTLYAFEGFTPDTRKLAMLRGKSPAGNVRFINDNTAVQIVDGMAFLRLWIDPTEPRGKGTFGRWYAEPVYYADIPEIKAGRYIPRAIKIHVGRTAWEPIPDSAKAVPPLTLFRDDVLVVGNAIGRFGKIDISGCRLIMTDVKSGSEIKGFPTIASWRSETRVAVLEEDCLGHCYARESIAPLLEDEG